MEKETVIDLADFGKLDDADAGADGETTAALGDTASHVLTIGDSCFEVDEIELVDEAHVNSLEFLGSHSCSTCGHSRRLGCLRILTSSV